MTNRHIILNFREAKGLSQSLFADQVGVSKFTVSRWESGKRRVPAERAVIIEQIYGIPREQLRPDLYTREATR